MKANSGIKLSDQTSLCQATVDATPDIPHVEDIICQILIAFIFAIAAKNLDGLL
mgnify:FL=1